MKPVTVTMDGCTEWDGLTWEIRPSLSPDGPHIGFEVKGEKIGRAWIPINPDQADAIAAGLTEAAAWCRHKAAA